MDSTVLYWPPLPDAPTTPNAAFWGSCNNGHDGHRGDDARLAAHTSCMDDESAPLRSRAVPYNKPVCSGL